ncbi:MAG TPA: ABC transporter permease [Anaerolineales bacterium]|nr:ABC transporter permease [Anaerolineales bacterium]
MITRTLKNAAWLGWQIETNWADPFIFAIYAIVKPIASALILVVMYRVVSGAGLISNGASANSDSQAIFSYIYLGNAFYIYVATVMTGVSWAVIDDREHYRTLKYIYTAPISFPTYLIGRGIARFFTGTISVLVTLIAGFLFLGVKIPWGQVNWLMFVGALLLGIVALVAMGMILAGITLMIVNHVWFVGEAVAGALYLFSGAIFPLTVLPVWLRPIGFALPITYWMELLRRALLGNQAQAFPALAQFSNLQLFAILGGVTLAMMAISALSFRWCENQARERSLLDMTTNY